MRFAFTADAEEFAEHAGSFVASALDANPLATVLADIRHGRYRDRSPRFAYGRDELGEVVCAALRTPPMPLLTTRLPVDGAGELVGGWLARDPGLSGVNGERDSARAIAAAWRDQTGGTTRCRMREAMHALDGVEDPPRAAPGRLRPATASDRELLIDWTARFLADAGHGTRAAGDAAPTLDAWRGQGRVSADPTPNRIYAAVGYRRVADWEAHEFIPTG